jgi:DNA primase
MSYISRMDNELLVLGLLESVLGKGKGSKTTMDYAFYCPVCKHKNPKLIVNIKSGQYNCWTCHPATKGKTPVSLLKKVDAPNDRIIEMKSYFQGDNTRIDTTKPDKVTLPEEFISLTNPDKTLESRHAIAYLHKRGITDSDVKKYGIGYCKTGRYRNRIIVPSYDKSGILNYFIARSFEKDPGRKYDAPTCNKTEIIGLEYFINWSVPIILCEGMFDAISIKRNAIPLFGKTIPKSLMMKLVESEVKTIYLALDKDALREALEYSQNLLNLGKEVYLIELEGKDPSDLGFNNMTRLLHKAKPLSFGDLLLKKIQLL